MKHAFKLEIGHNRSLRGDYYPARSQAQGTLILCHGYKGFKDWAMFPYVANRLSEQFDVLTFNFSYNGVGEGEQFDELEKFAHNHFGFMLEDLSVLLSEVRQGRIAEIEISRAPIFLLGHSRGGGVALLQACEDDGISGVVLWNSISHTALFTEAEKERLRTDGRIYIQHARTKQQMPLDLSILLHQEQYAERYALLERLSSCRVPIMWIQGSRDHEKLRTDAEILFKRYDHINRVEISGGDHTFGSVHPFAGASDELEQALCETRKFLDQQIKFHKPFVPNMSPQHRAGFAF